MAAKDPIRVLITGAAGQIGYALAPMVARGVMLGPDQPVILHLLDIEPAANALQGVEAELVDGAFPLLHGIVATTDANVACKGVQVACMIGGFPRGPGMERKDVMAKNVSIYGTQGSALKEHAHPDVKVVVVANPANTNALILQERSGIPAKNITCLTRLDHNRALGQIAQRTGRPVSEVKNCIIWGNHSSTQYPDINHASVTRADGIVVPVRSAVNDDEWIEGEFVKTVQQRGAYIIQKRKLSSSLSAANAVCDHIRNWLLGTAPGEWVSMGVITEDTNEYGIPSSICYSFPVTCQDGQWKIVADLPIDKRSRELMDATTKELQEEKQLAYTCLEEQGMSADR
mmetsp:Transcript_9470/g.10977  ORF Transcript_9470/g.10977 Transcript_9470/m.10977 type:complete len:344 (+) Transcript_9470:85-1116(+)|eukprot:CAMPEP_0197860764 /NCGR_PEP_ID=MMETSP1438-20131217/36368_1 /TAXON_ID=1461541 /ORGANISM="Pterosperma sp., Strain CCMP1384" /LENGTH=343 /DNA_ID=CAMNT_0043477743 /DNA_START=77 /DNA_END=1108 /DNA_ORIENTATION=+